MLSRKAGYPTVKMRDFLSIHRALWDSVGGCYSTSVLDHGRRGMPRDVRAFFDITKASNLTRLYFEEDTLGILPELINPFWQRGDNLYGHRLLLTPTRFIMVRLNRQGDVEDVIQTKDWMNSGVVHLNYRGVLPAGNHLFHRFELKCEEFSFFISVGKNWFSSVTRFLSGFLPVLTDALGKMIYFPRKIGFNFSYDSYQKLYEMCLFPEAGYSRKKFRILRPDYQNIESRHKVELMKKNKFLPVVMPITQTYPNCVFYSTNIDKVVIDESISRVYDSVIYKRGNRTGTV